MMSTYRHKKHERTIKIKSIKKNLKYIIERSYSPEAIHLAEVSIQSCEELLREPGDERCT
jgi:hypothetical protein